MASFAMLPLTDASRDSRIHDWIAEQYSFALSEFQDDHLWCDDPPSLRESRLLPDDFDLITATCPTPPPRRDSDSDRGSVYDPPLLPSPLPLLCDAPSDSTPQARTDLEDAFDGLLHEMNLWRFAPARRSARSALTLSLSDRNKVRLTLFSEFASLGLRAQLRHFRLRHPYPQPGHATDSTYRITVTDHRGCGAKVISLSGWESSSEPMFHQTSIRTSCSSP
jgi:hypothetical protein